MATVPGRPFTKETAPRTGGKPGRITRKRLMRENAELIALGKAISPLEVLSGFAADKELDDGLRINAATAAARYVHRPMPQAVEHSGTVRLRHTFAEAVLNDEDDGTPA